MGKKSILDGKWNYHGELDSHGQPHGFGEATNSSRCGIFSYQGTFLNGTFEGLGVIVKEGHYRSEGEFKAGKPHGKHTEYGLDITYNHTFENGQKLNSQEIASSDFAFYREE